MSSILAKAFSSKLIRGAYEEEKPEIPLEIKGSHQEVKRLTHMVNRIARTSPVGKSILEEAAKAGFSLSFEVQLGSIGYCSEEKKAIVLEPMFSDDRLIGTLVHEGRHAQQFTNGADEKFGQRTIKSELMYFRAMEADAQACAAVSIMEMKENGDKKPWNAFGGDDASIARRLHSFEKSGKTEQISEMLDAAFGGWYLDNLTKEAYELAYIVKPMSKAMKKKKEKDMPYNKVETSEEIAELVCRGPKGCYLSNKKCLEDENKLDISASTYNRVDHFFKVRKERTGMAPDTSYQGLKTRLPLSYVSLYAGGYGGGYYQKKNHATLLLKKAEKGR